MGMGIKRDLGGLGKEYPAWKMRGREEWERGKHIGKGCKGRREESS